ncbi:efflux transporter outer membrane subunit [Paucibacter sp. R3-3]|uniref:Efflux transporter outer membrane subunit n=1 Tax=Roseateles agri TaxID=3098619 RepID=A0ABU5DU29_9BURK|nr:efflux transporter outer membrane subunit [Paucibacter sp. R3-3]MDY0749069.1 efflux transporter outer membrane subunit [Paucibacter sp. R3-3]
MKLNALILAFGTGLLTACASTGGLSTHGKLMDVQQLASAQSLSVVALSPAAWPTEQWWEVFGDPQLDQLIRQALKEQPSLRIAAARVRQAHAVTGIIGASLSPQANASLKSTEQHFSATSIYPKTLAGQVNSINDASLGVSYELDFWGRNHAALDAALDRAHATEVDAQAARLVLTTSLARAYLRLDTAYAQRDLAERTLHQREQILDLVRKRVAAKLDSSLELTQAEGALPVAREQIAAIAESIALTNNQIAALAGQGPDAGLSITRPHLSPSPALALPTNVPAELLGRRPDLVAERWRVEATTQDIKVARAGFYPNITLSAFAGVQSIGLGDFLTAGSRMLGVGPAISLPVFDGGRLRANLDLRQGDYDVAVETYNATLIAALHDVVTQLVSMKWLADERREQDQGLALAEQSYQLARNRFQNGLANYLQVLSAEAMVLNQQHQQIESEGRQRELQLNLIRALGGGYAPSAS